MRAASWDGIDLGWNVRSGPCDRSNAGGRAKARAVEIEECGPPPNVGRPLLLPTYPRTSRYGCSTEAAVRSRSVRSQAAWKSRRARRQTGANTASNRRLRDGIDGANLPMLEGMPELRFVPQFRLARPFAEPSYCQSFADRLGLGAGWLPDPRHHIQGARLPGGKNLPLLPDKLPL